MLYITIPEESIEESYREVFVHLYTTVQALGGSIRYSLEKAKSPSQERERNSSSSCESASCPTGLSHERLGQILTRVCRLTGCLAQEICSTSRVPKHLYARLFLVHLACQEGATVSQLCLLLGRAPSTIYRLRKQYDQEALYNPAFRKIVSRSQWTEVSKQWAEVSKQWYWHEVFAHVVGAICKSPTLQFAHVFNCPHVEGLIAISPYTCVFWTFTNMHVNTKKDVMGLVWGRLRVS